MQRFGQGIERATRACDEHPSARIAHVQYSDLMEDPVGVTRRVYSALDLEFSTEAAARMSAFLASPQKDKHRNHYRAGVFGLDESEIRATFAPYMQRFGVEPDRRERKQQASPAALVGERLPGS